MTALVVLPILKKLKVGQIEREDGPQSHLSKQGTPTMGGVILAGAITALIIFVFLNFNYLKYLLKRPLKP